MIYKRKIISAVLLFSLLFICINSPTYGKDHTVIRGTVTKVNDGDTIVIRPFSGKLFKCRLYGIDAPEIAHNGRSGQPHSNAAERELTNLILHTTVVITLTGDKTYDREVCIIKKMGVEINREMVIRGYAWAYREYLKGPYASR